MMPTQQKRDERSVLICLKLATLWRGLANIMNNNLSTTSMHEESTNNSGKAAKEKRDEQILISRC